MEFISSKTKYRKGQVVNFGDQTLKIVKVITRDNWDKVKGIYKYEASIINQNSKKNPAIKMKKG